MKIDMAKEIKFFFIIGEPGVGKTTLTKKLIILLKNAGIKLAGFFTEEVRNERVREGFDVVSLDGRRGRLAREHSLVTTPSPYKVGRYTVLLPEFERIALPTLRLAPNDRPQCVIMDEIGKMEYFSLRLRKRVKQIFNCRGICPVVVTIPVKRGDCVIDCVKDNPRAKVWTVTKANRSFIHEKIFDDLKVAIGF